MSRVHLDPWPVDGVGTARVRMDGRDVGEVTIAPWPDHLVIHGIVASSDAPDDLERRVVEAVFTRLERTPRWLTHASIARLDTLRFYAEGPFGEVAVVNGTLAGRGLFYDALADVLDALDPAQVEEPLSLVLTADADFAPWLRGPADPRVFASVLVERPWLARIVALRRVATSAAGEPESADRLHHLALTDDISAVRQFAAVQMSRMLPARYVPGLERLLQAVADPLAWPAALAERGPYTSDGHPYDPARARHNVRVALLWVAGNLAWVADGYHAAGLPDTERLGRGLRAALAEAVTRGTRCDDAFLDAAAAAAVDGDPAALGTEAPLGLFDVARWAVLRDAYRSGGGDDPFAWILGAVHALVPPDATGPVAAALYAPAGRKKPSSHATSSVSTSS